MTWEEAYSQLASYYKQQGHTNIQPDNDIQLQFSFCVLQKLYKKNALSKEQINLLEIIHFPFKTKRNTWHDNYIELQLFIQEKGIFLLRTKEPTLYSWLMSQRYQERQNTLPDTKKNKLKSIGIKFNQVSQAAAWDISYNRLRNELATLQPPFKINNLSKKSRAWLKYQKTAALSPKYDKGKIEKLKLLEINYKKESYEEKWLKQFNEYCKVKSSTTNVIPSSLLRWCLEQRRKYHECSLSQSRIRLLNSIGFNWKRN